MHIQYAALLVSLLLWTWVIRSRSNQLQHHFKSILSFTGIRIMSAWHDGNQWVRQVVSNHAKSESQSQAQFSHVIASSDWQLFFSLSSFPFQLWVSLILIWYYPLIVLQVHDGNVSWLWTQVHPSKELEDACKIMYRVQELPNWPLGTQARAGWYCQSLPRGTKIKSSWAIWWGKSLVG